MSTECLSHILLNAEFVKEVNARDIMIRQLYKLEALRYVSSLSIQKKDNTIEKRITEYSKTHV
jgi:hypothetical protein